MAEERTAEDIARERASRQARRAQQKAEQGNDRESHQRGPAAGLTTYDELIQREAARTSIVKTSSGLAFEVGALAPGDFAMLLGSPFLQRFTDAGIDVRNENTVKETVERLDGESVARLVTDPELLNASRALVCLSVTSINFVDKPQQQCDQEREEISVDLLDFVDLMNICTAILRLSTPSAEAADAVLFREADEEEQGSGDPGAPDGEELRSPAVEGTVPVSKQS